MSGPLLIALGGNEDLANSMVRSMGVEHAEIEQRRFPDGETYMRYLSSPEGRPVIILASLDRPDDKVLPLMFAAEAARDLGAASVGLVCPYLPYMRQDHRFNPGEVITSDYFANILSRACDWLVTIDPHLHRHKTLSELYTVPATALHAAPLIAEWIRTSVEQPLLIGPDAESEQWVSAVASLAGTDHIVLEKVRLGDRRVKVSVADIERWRAYTPVIVDDIISTGRTMIETVGNLVHAGMRPPVCVGVHAIFAGTAYDDLLNAGANRVVTCNTVPHPTNVIDVTALLSDAVREYLSVAAAERLGK